LDGFGNFELLEQAVNKTVEESLIDLLPSYKEVLNRSPLQIFSGGKTLFGSGSKTKTVSPTASVGGWGIKNELSVKKGSVFGGLEKYFSPIKTRSARKFIKEKEQEGNLILKVSEGLRALRAQKSLARGIK
jgi:hypothetical protein